MANRLFKRLFEVNILHGYYLDHLVWDKNQKPKIYQDYSFDEQNEALLRYNILNDLSFEPTPATQNLLRGLHMRWAASPLGFFTGIEVERQAPDQYLPFQPLPLDAVWTFIARIRNPYWQNITNHALRPTLPGCYYFTNQPIVAGKTPPTLSAPPPAFDANRFWEMGELISDGAGNILRARKRSDQIGDFAAFPNQHWANTADRIALPKSFLYRFDAKTPVQAAVFRLLMPGGGALLKTIQKQFASPPETYRLDLRALDKLPGEILPKPTKDGWYDLEVVLNGALFERRSILLRSDLPADASVFAIIDIANHSTSDGFQLLNPNQTLRYAPNPNNQKIEPLRFQINLLPRATYWQYLIEKFAESTLPNSDHNYGAVQYVKNTHQLISTEPRALTRIRTPLQVTTDVYLPNPERADLQYDPTNGQFISQLFLQTIKLS